MSTTTEPRHCITETNIAGLWRVVTTEIPWLHDPANPFRTMTEVRRLGHWHDGRYFVRMGWGTEFHEAVCAALRERGEEGAMELPQSIGETPYRRS